MDDPGLAVQELSAIESSLGVYNEGHSEILNQIQEETRRDFADDNVGRSFALVHYSFRPGGRVSIIYGKFAGLQGIIDSRPFLKTIDCPPDSAPDYDMAADIRTVVILMRARVSRGNDNQ